jgi:hypothetical protein
VYSGLYLNGAKHTVDLWLTDPTKAASIVKAAHKLDPAADLRRLRIHRGTYSQRALDRASDALFAESKTGKLPYTVFTTTALYNGSALLVGVPDPAKARNAAAVTHHLMAESSTPAVSLTFEAARKPQPMSSTYNKFDDNKNWIGGDQIANPNDLHDACTAGFAADDSSGHQYLVTAGHCTVGTVAARSYPNNYSGKDYFFDAELISGNSYYNDEGEGSTPANSWWAVLNGGVAYSYAGDIVCQNGMMTSYSQGRTPCNIRVTNSDFKWANGNGQSRGVRGATTDGSIGAMSGDSGGTVFTYNSGTRQLRGIISTGFGCWSVPVNGWPDQLACNDIAWTEAVDVLNHFGLHQDTKS